MASPYFQSNFAEWSRTFERYRQSRKMSVNKALEKRAQALAFKLYSIAMKHSPRREWLLGLPPHVGWRIKRAPGMAVFTTRSATGHKVRKLAYIKKKDGTVVEKIRTRTVKQVLKYGEMERRVKGIGITARGWIPMFWSSPNGVPFLTKIRRPKGRVEFRMLGDFFIISIINRMPGAPGMENKYNIVGQALRAEIDDMTAYLQKVMEKEREQFKL